MVVCSVGGILHDKEQSQWSRVGGRKATDQRDPARVAPLEAQFWRIHQQPVTSGLWSILCAEI
jgi:hypothetical protein